MIHVRNVALPALIIIASALGGCGKKDEAAAKSPDAPKPAAVAPAPPKGLPVKAEPVKVGEVQSDVTAVGTLLAADSVVIRPEIAGRVVGLHFQEGQIVAKGAKLVTLDPAEYRAQLAGTSADARTEAMRFERAQELLDKNFISKEALDVAQGNMERAVAKRQQDEALLAKTSILAPFSGIVGLRQISPGAYVRAGDDIVRLENVSSVKVDFRVPEAYLSKLKTNQEVSLKTDAFPNETFKGRIFALEPGVDEKTRTVVARALVPNQQNKLRAGMFARVSVLLETRAHSILVPEQAIWPQGRDTFVYRVVDGKASLTKIELGVRRPGEVEVVKGLSAADMVVTDGQMKLKDGAPVTVMPITPAAPAPGKAA